MPPELLICSLKQQAGKRKTLTIILVLAVGKKASGLEQLLLENLLVKKLLLKVELVNRSLFVAASVGESNGLWKLSGN